MREVAIALVLLACGGTAAAEPATPATVVPAWPKLELTNLVDHRPIDVRGKVVIYHVFATWDGQGGAFPKLEAMQKRYADRGVLVVAFSCNDDAPTIEADIVEYAKKHGATFPVAFDRGHRLTDLVHPPNEPTTWIVDRDGSIRYVEGGYRDGLHVEIERELLKVLDGR